VLLRGCYFLVPFATLIYLLFFKGQPPAVAAIWSTAIMVLGGLIFSYKGRKIRLADLYDVLASTGLVVVELLMIVASAGFVIGVLNMTGLGLALPNSLIEIAGNNQWVVLAIAAVACIILGMGMPTAAVYILLAALVAPAVVDAGFDNMPDYMVDLDPGMQMIPAHMFILYFGMMSMITPPIALAAFAAATLTKADPMATGFVAMRFGWTAYVVPFLFVLSPTLLMFGSPWEIALNVATVTIGVYLISVAVIGYFARPIGWTMRIILIVAGIAAMLPDIELGLLGIADAAGVAVGVVLLGRELIAVRGRAAVAETS